MEFTPYTNLVREQEIDRIHDVCKKYQISNYKINKDYTVDVEGDVRLNFFYFEALPIHFGVVSGNFECADCSLTTLEGVPREVGGFFMIIDNWLKAFDYFPDKIGGEIHTNGNNIPISQYNVLFKKGFTPDQIHCKEDLTSVYRISVINNIVNEH